MNHDEDEPVRMTVEEIGLMREIVRWRRNRIKHGLPETEFVKRKVYGAPYWTEYSTGREVWFDPHGQEHALAIVRRKKEWPVRVPAESLTEAVDVLVAYGFLPARFSSAHRAGYDSGRAMAATQDGAGKRPDGDPIPAVGYDEYGFPL